MNTATLSSKFQISVPKPVRDALGLVPGQKLAFIQNGSCVRLVPQAAVTELVGIARGANTEHLRDREVPPRLPPGPRCKQQADRDVKLPDTCVWVEVLADTPTGRYYRAKTPVRTRS